MTLIESIIERARSNRQRIVLPESLEERTIKAADRAIADGLAEIILIGNRQEILGKAAEYGLKNIDKATIIDPETSEKTAEYTNLLYELRKSKGMTPEQAATLVRNPLYFGCLIIKSGDADGQISGALSTTLLWKIAYIQLDAAVLKFYIVVLCIYLHNGNELHYSYN